MSIVLGIDTSSADLSVGITRDGVPLASFCRFVGNSHAERITAAIGAVIESCNVAPVDINRIAIAVGPGSFTGLRIGIAFIKGFCAGREAPVLPVSSLEVLAHATHLRNGRAAAAIDARNDSVYWASFDAVDGTLIRRSDDIVSTKEAFFAAIGTDDQVAIDTLGWKKSTLHAEISDRCVVWPVDNHPLQRGLICALEGARTPGQDPRWCTALDIKPNYIRRSMPEERLSREPPL